MAKPSLTLRFPEHGKVHAELKVSTLPINAIQSGLPSRSHRQSRGVLRISPWSVLTTSGAPAFGNPFQQKQFTLTPEFRLPSTWELDDLKLEDATGNSTAAAWDTRYGPPPRLSRYRRPWESMSVPFNLCSNETAWKLTAILRRTTGATFATQRADRVRRLRNPGRPGHRRPRRNCCDCGGILAQYGGSWPVLIPEKQVSAFSSAERLDHSRDSRGHRWIRACVFAIAPRDSGRRATS